MVSALHVLIVWIACTIWVVIAQTISSNVTCVSSYRWSLNSIGQTPCLVAAYLGSRCYNLGYTVDSIPPGYKYRGPRSTDGATHCECSTPFYMLISACGGCQNRDWLPLSSFTYYCPPEKTPPDGVYPEVIDKDTSVPHWAFLSVKNMSGNFDPGLASLAGDAPESSWFLTSTTSSVPTTTSLPPPTTSGSLVFIPTITNSGSQITITSTLPPTSTSTTPTQTPTHTSSGGGGGSNVGAIAGGTVGGVIGILLIALFGTLIYRHEKELGKRRRDDETAATAAGVRPTGEARLKGSPDGGNVLMGERQSHLSGITATNQPSFSSGQYGYQGPPSPNSPTSPHSQVSGRGHQAFVVPQSPLQYPTGHYTGMPEGH